MGRKRLRAVRVQSKVVGDHVSGRRAGSDAKGNPVFLPRRERCEAVSVQEKTIVEARARFDKFKACPYGVR